jgi:hypothetical protein
MPKASGTVFSRGAPHQASQHTQRVATARLVVPIIPPVIIGRSQAASHGIVGWIGHAGKARQRALWTSPR